MTDFPDNARMCGTCFRMLEGVQVTGPTGVRGPYYRHSTQDLPEDHPAVPIPVVRELVLARCDFCNANVPLAEGWVVPCKDFAVIVLGNQDHWSIGDWQACPTCASVIAAGDWGEAVRRMVQGWRKRNPETGTIADQVAEMIASMATGVRENITGAPYKETNT